MKNQIDFLTHIRSLKDEPEELNKTFEEKINSANIPAKLLPTTIMHWAYECHPHHGMPFDDFIMKWGIKTLDIADIAKFADVVTRIMCYRDLRGFIEEQLSHSEEIDIDILKTHMNACSYGGFAYMIEKTKDREDYKDIHQKLINLWDKLV